MVSKTALDKVLPYTDAFLYDVKALSETVHKTCTGHTNEQILDNLLYLDKKGAVLEIRIPYVPNLNDGEMEKIGAFLSGLRGLTKVRVLAYHNLAGAKYNSLGLENRLSQRLPTAEDMERARQRLKAYGLPVEE